MNISESLSKQQCNFFIFLYEIISTVEQGEQ